MPILGGIRRDAKLVIQKLRASLRRIRHKFHSVETGQEQGHDVLSPPVLKLPPELLGRVFLLQLASEEPVDCTCGAESAISKRDCTCGAAIGISKRILAAKKVHHNMFVCKTWRAVIQEIPQLWSTVGLDEWVVAKRPEFEKKRFRLWAARSANAPLCVVLRAETSSWLIPIWNKMVGRERARLGEVALLVRTYGKVPLDVVKSIWADLAHASQLTSLHIDNLELHPRSFLQAPCLPNLRHLHICRARPPTILMPSLRSLIVECTPAFSAWDYQGLLETSPHLERVHLIQVLGGAEQPVQSFDNDRVRPFVQRNLEYIHIELLIGMARISSARLYFSQEAARA
jgi:hypothetical protein